MPPRARATFPALVALVLAGCAGEQAPTQPGDPNPPPDLGRAAFQLTIDNRTGAVTVARPGAAAASHTTSAKPSFSLIGSEAVRLVGSGAGGSIQCVWSAIANSSKLRRCSFDLALQSTLGYTDLVTPTTFPKPPAGTQGILVFPFAAAALGVPGSGATPSPDWDKAPYNFFNDASGCFGGKTSDCYRWELYPGNLHAGETTPARRVGFDVDKSAQSVAVSIVVAADLRDNPPQVLALGPEFCGYFGFADNGDALGDFGGSILVGWSARPDAVRFKFRGLCRFPLPGWLGGKHIARATLRFQQLDAVGTPFTLLGPLVADHMQLVVSPATGVTFSNFGAPALEEDIGTLSADDAPGARTLDVGAAVLDDIAASRVHSDYRFRFSGEGSSLSAPTYAEFGGQAPAATAPQLEVVYSEP